jgi:hypothetical protein
MKEIQILKEYEVKDTLKTGTITLALSIEVLQKIEAYKNKFCLWGEPLNSRWGSHYLATFKKAKKCFNKTTWEETQRMLDKEELLIMDRLNMIVSVIDEYNTMPASECNIYSYVEGAGKKCFQKN